MLIWKRSAHNVMRCEAYRIVRFQWRDGSTYILWHHSTVLGTYTSADDAKTAAESHQNGLQAANAVQPIYLSSQKDAPDR